MSSPQPDCSLRSETSNLNSRQNGRVSPVSSLSDSSDSDSSSSESPQRPPDGGWGWVVVFASFMVNLISDGVSLSFGLLFVELVDYFGESKGKTAWVGSIFLSMPLLTGPIASYLADRHGCRWVSIIGGLLAATGFVVSYMANSLEVLFLTFTLAGFGLALCYVASIVIVAYYFEKRRSLATGLAVCGTGIGTFVFPPVTTFLLEAYGWRGTLLILAGFFLNIMVFGGLMRDLEDFPSSSSSSSSATGSHPDVIAGSTNQLSPPNTMRLCNSLVQLPTYMNNSTVPPVEVITELTSREGGCLNNLLQQYPNLVSTFLDCDPNMTIKSTPPLSYLSPSTSKQAASSQSRKGSLWRSGGKPAGGGSLGMDSAAVLRNMRLQRGSITYRGAMLSIRRYRLRASSCPDIYRNSMVTIVDSNKMCPWLRDLKDLILDVVDLSIFRNLQYSLFCLSNFLLYAFVDVPYVYLPDSAIGLGVDKESASFLISVLGILNTAGVVIVGYAGDKPWMASSVLYSLFMLVSGAAMGLVPLAQDYHSLCVLVAAYGFAISANYTLVPVIIVDIISLDSFTNAYGLLLLVQGIANLVGPPLAGWLFDMTQSYDSTFYLTGLCIFLSGLLTAPITKKCRQPKRAQHSATPRADDDDPEEHQDDHDGDIPETYKKGEKVRFKINLETNGFIKSSSPIQQPDCVGNGFARSGTFSDQGGGMEMESLLPANRDYAPGGVASPAIEGDLSPPSPPPR